MFGALCFVSEKQESSIPAHSSLERRRKEGKDDQEAGRRLMATRSIRQEQRDGVPGHTSSETSFA